MADRRTGGWLLAGAALAAAGYAAVQRLREDALVGQVVLIAGASRGLGLVMAHEFAAEGCRLALCARDPESLEKARRELEEAGAEVIALPCDVADPAQVRSMVARVMDHYGCVDVLVNNAAIMQVGPVAAMPRDEFERAMAVNFWGAYNTIAEVAPEMRARGYGRIVNVTSMGGKVSLPHMVPYCCGKFAMVGLSEGLAVELAKDGIKVTTVVPGLVRTGSQVNAFYRGDPEKEWSWFTLSGANPLNSMSAARAARRIVRAAARGERQVTLSWPAHLLVGVHGIAPGLNIRALAFANRLLPTATGGPRTRGMELDTPVSPSPATALMNQAAREQNQYGGRPEPSPGHAASAGVREER
jgi:NAD(P)-dependent dehydrogenase (short-subunit alcohol dehydrogenase family)